MMTAQQAIREIAPFLQELLNAVADGVSITDPDGFIIMVNDMYARQTGYRREELVGQQVRELVASGTVDVALNPSVMTTGKAQTTVQNNRRGRTLVLSAQPLFDAHGRIGLVVTFVRDITGISQLRDQVAEQSKLIEKFRRDVLFLSQSGPDLPPVAQVSEASRQMDLFVRQVAPTDATVLILGETGVGKGVFAKRIHQASNRCDKPMLKVDCAAIPENLIESELFGYVSGAFSGASSKGKPGQLEMADNATVFLDEIGELSLSMQKKLLRFLQDREILPVGAVRPRPVDVRVIAATNRELQKEVEQGRFRSDLYFRLNVAVLTIPPLRERRSDIIPLARSFLRHFCARYRKTASFSREAEQAMAAYAWPGNIRELEHIVEARLITQSQEIIRLGDLPPRFQTQPCLSLQSPLSAQILNNEEISLKDILNMLETNILREALAHYGSVKEVSRRFKMHRATLFRKLKHGGQPTLCPRAAGDSPPGVLE